MGRDNCHQTRLLQALTNLALDAAREGAATVSLANLCRCLTTSTVKNFFLISSLNLPSFSLKPLPLVLSLQSLVKSSSPAFLYAHSGTGRLQQGVLRAFSSFHEQNYLYLQIQLQEHILNAWQGFSTHWPQGLTMNDSRKSLRHIDFIQVNLNIY